MLTWTRKRAFVSWRTGIYAFFPGIYAYFPGKYAHIFGFKMHQVQKCQKWCNYAHVEKNRSKSRNLANEHLFVLFRGYRYIYIYIITLYNHTEPRNGQFTRFRELNINIIPTLGSQKRDQLPHRGSTTRKFLPSSAVREATSLSPTGAWQKTNFSSHPMIWANYNNSLTWIKAIWGWFPLLTIVPVRSQWGRYNLPRMMQW